MLGQNFNKIYKYNFLSKLKLIIALIILLFYANSLYAEYLFVHTPGNIKFYNFDSLKIIAIDTLKVQKSASTEILIIDTTKSRFSDTLKLHAIDTKKPHALDT